MEKKVEIKKVLSQRTIGIEIEFYARVSQEVVAGIITAAGIPCFAERYNHIDNDAYWKIVTDGSLQNAPVGHNNPMELVSPILQGDEALAVIRKVCDLLNSSEIDARVNTTCGLHVHHDASDFVGQNFKNIFNIYKFYEKEMDEMVSPSRRLDRNGMIHTLAFEDDYRNIMGDANSHLRYHKLNLCSFERHGTIEFRQMNGTTDGDKICGWVVFTQAITEHAKRATVVRRGRTAQYNIFRAIKLYDWLSDGNEETNELCKQIRKWVNARKRQLARAAA